MLETSANGLKDWQMDTDEADASSYQIRADAASRADLGPLQSAPEQLADNEAHVLSRGIICLEANN